MGFGGVLLIFAPWHSGGLIAAVTVLGLVSTGIAFALNYQSLSKDGAVTTSTVGYLMPVVSIVLGAVFLGEEVNPRVIGGLAMVLIGVTLTRVKRRTRTEAPENVEAAQPSA